MKLSSVLHFHVGFLVTISISIFIQSSVFPFVIPSLALSLNIFIKHTDRTVKNTVHRRKIIFLVLVHPS